MIQLEDGVYCIWCYVKANLRTIFGKDVYECPNCKLRVPVEEVVVPAPE